MPITSERTAAIAGKSTSTTCSNCALLQKRKTFSLLLPIFQHPKCAVFLHSPIESLRQTCISINNRLPDKVNLCPLPPPLSSLSWLPFAFLPRWHHNLSCRLKIDANGESVSLLTLPPASRQKFFSCFSLSNKESLNDDSSMMVCQELSCLH